MKKIKIYSSILIICILLTACGSQTQNKYNPKNRIESSSNVTPNTQETAISETGTPDAEIVITETPSTETSVPETVTSTVNDIVTETASILSATAEPTWTEETILETLYIKTDCYERRKAYKGAPEGSKLKKGTKVIIVAKTNTEYYKMENGRYIHEDFTSITKPSIATTTPKPTATPAPTPNLTPKPSSFESEINKVNLNPVRTNNKLLDSKIDAILNKIIKNGMTNSQKIKAVYDYMIANFTRIEDRSRFSGSVIGFSGDNAYVSNSDLYTAYYAYNMIEAGGGVCNDYAALFTVITRAIGFDSYTVSGDVRSSKGGYTGHAWNNVKVGNTWYEFDVQIEDKYNELRGYTGYYYYGKARMSDPTLYIYSEDTGEKIAAFKKFQIADPLLCNVTIKVGDQKLDLTYEKNKPEVNFWFDAEDTEEYIDYVNTTPPELNVTLGANFGTAPYSYDVSVLYYDNEYIFDESFDNISDKTKNFTLQLSDFGEYTVKYKISDSSGRTLCKQTTIYVTRI